MADGRSDWAGNFECSVCRQKRLTAASFSKRMIERHRSHDAKLTCKQCVEAAAATERAAATAKVEAEDGTGAVEAVCSACGVSKPASRFTRAQIQKGEGKQRCTDCVATAEASASSKADKKWEIQYQEAKEVARKAEATGTTAEKLQAHNRVAALEAQKVTGLKPVVLGKRGRGTWRGSARGRGRS
mmetsp:Transcript_22342/g.68011  ORF Transcript_22342/g.68011 Transcript_22342/m.68011 type:complete len:186 (-) Transcript_22342:219-776(-)